MKRLSMRLAAGSGPTFGVDDLPCAAATHLNCWADKGLDVTWTPVRGGVAAIQAVIDGSVDASYGGLGPVLKVRSEGAPVRVVVSMARALAQNLVAQASITSASQLRGVSWAVDGIGALSHHMARLIVRALGIDEREIDWQVAGPPPERIAMLLAGKVDVALLRVEEAIALSLDATNTLHTLLDSAALKRLVPNQPHGVLAARQDYIDTREDEISRLVKGMIVASRALNDDFGTFERVYRHYIKVSVPDDQIREIWRNEQESQSYALDGELSADHWQKQADLFLGLHPTLPRLAIGDVIEGKFVASALTALGRRGTP